MILVQANGNAFGLLVGERAMADENDPEVQRGIQIGTLLPVDENGEAVRAVADNRNGGCGCG